MVRLTGPTVSSAEDLGWPPFSYYGPNPFQEGFEVTIQALGWRKENMPPAAAGFDSYCISGLLIQTMPRESFKTARQGLFGSI